MGHEGNHAAASPTPGSPKLTPRQKLMLELASIELSDDEIAARLNLSPRSIRFQLERIFGMLGVRNRSEAIATLMDSKRRAPRPIDECPYPKPFPANFEECPGYQALQVVTPDERSRPAGRIWTCRHFEGRLMAKTRHRWYGACVLGDTAGRKRWAERVGPDRLRTLNHLLHELAPVTASFAHRLWELKGDQVRALEQKQDPKPATLLMESVAARFLGDIEAFLDRRRRLLEQNQLAIDECLNLARRQIDRVLDPGSPAEWDNRFDVLMRLPEDVWSASLLKSRESAIQAAR